VVRSAICILLSVSAIVFPGNDCMAVRMGLEARAEGQLELLMSSVGATLLSLAPQDLDVLLPLVEMRLKEMTDCKTLFRILLF
jgi:hypothetical protein